MSTYPTRNPFPSRATMSMEERVDDAEILDLEISGPTVPLPSVSAMAGLVRRYLADTAEQPLRGQGQAAFLHGAHGSGKTHAIRHALGRSSGEAVHAQAIRLYAKAQDDDFAALYRRLMGQVGRAPLRDISLSFLGALATDNIGGGGPESAVLTSVRRQPEQVHRLFTELLVERGAVLEAQADEVARVADDGDEFQRALTSLLDPALEEAAHDWLAGRDLDPVDAERLGVSGPITDPDRCRYGLQLLTAMCARIGRPIILVIDQCEKLILGNAGNVGLLHSLVERVPQDNGMLILAGNEAAWEAVPPDLRQRFGQNQFDTALVSPREARDLIAAYIGVVTGDDVPTIRPFTESALPSLLTLSGGNVRIFLQLCWLAFQAAVPRRAEIDGEIVRQAAGREPPTPQDAIVAIERLLLDEQVVYQRDWQDDDFAADFLVMSSSGPRILFQVKNALFSTDEAYHALSSVNLLERVRARGWSAQVVLVVLGYSSPEVLDLLRRTANEVVVFDGSRAMEQLRATTRALAPLSVAPPDRAELELIRESLERISESRRRDKDKLLSASLSFAADPADLFVRLYDELPDRVFEGWTATEWFDDVRVRGQAEAVRETVLEHGLLDPARTKAIVAGEGDRGRFMILLGLDAALAHANPYGPYHNAPALTTVLVRYLTEGRLNGDEQDGALLPRCARPTRPSGRRTKAEFFGVHRIPVETWDRVEHRILPTAHDVHFNRDEPVPVGCVPLLESFDDLDLRFEERYGLILYRLGPRDSTVLRTRIREAIRRLDESEARFAVLPEAALSDELLEYWKEIAFETADRERPLRFLFLGTGPLGAQDPPPNRAVLLDRWTGEEIFVQDKRFGQVMDAEQMRQWRLPGAPDTSTAEEYIVPGSQVSLLDCVLGRLTALVGEDLSRSTYGERILGSCGVSHLFAPIFSRPILQFRWEQENAERWTRNTGCWVTVANSLVVDSVLPHKELPGPRYTCLISGPEGDGRSRSVLLQFGNTASGDKPASLGPTKNGVGQLPMFLPGSPYERWQDRPPSAG